MPVRRVKSQVRANIDLWLNNLFLRDGFYTTIASGQADIYGRDNSALTSVPDPDFPDNSVFQSAFKNWVHESGLIPDHSITPPIVASGVVVDGIFYPRDPLAPGFNASFVHNIDYVNGRILFSSPVGSSSAVQAAFSYKHMWVDYSDRFENEQDEFYIETAFKDNPMQTGVVTYPRRDSVPMPAIMIDFLSREQDPYELGSASNVAVFRGTFHLWARNNADKDLVEDLLSQQEHTVLAGIDFNSAPMPLDRFNDKNPAFTSYEDFADINGPHFFKRIYIDEISQKNSSPFYNIERGRLDFLIRVYPNF